MSSQFSDARTNWSYKNELYDTKRLNYNPCQYSKFNWFILQEMLVPTPLQQTLSNKLPLFHPIVADEVEILLSIRDENLVPQLLMSLSQTNVDHIKWKEQYQQQIALHTQQQKNNPEFIIKSYIADKLKYFRRISI